MVLPIRWYKRTAVVTKEREMRKNISIVAAAAIVGMLSGCNQNGTDAAATTQSDTVAQAAVTTPAVPTTDEKPETTTPEAAEETPVVNHGEDEADAQNDDEGNTLSSSNVSEDNDEESTASVDEPAEAVKAGWYMRTVVTAILPNGKVYKHDSAGVFGELDGSTDKRDNHDIESYGVGTLQIRFVNLKVDFQKEYFSDYRSYTEEDEKRTWEFFVTNETGDDLSNAELRIEVEPMKEVLKKEGENRYVSVDAASDEDKRNSLILVDIDNQKTYSYAEVKGHVFNMDGKKTRSFRWVLNGSVTSDDMKKIYKLESMTTQASTIAQPTADSKFGLPPM